MASSVSGVYELKNVLHREGIDSELQKGMQTITKIASASMEDNAPIHALPDLGMTDLTLLNLNVAILSSHGGGFFGGGDCGGSGEGVAIIGFIFLVLSAVAMGILTGYQGWKADSYRRQKSQLEDLKTKQPELASSCDSLIKILHAEHIERSISTGMSAGITAGLVMLTVAAVFAIIATFVTQTPIAPFVKILALAGGATVGGGILGHIVLAIYKECVENTRIENYKELLEEIRGFKKMGIITPWEVLEASKQSSCYLVTGNRIHYLKDGKYWNEEVERSSSGAVQLSRKGRGATPVQVPNRD